MKQERCRICRQPLKNAIYGSRCEDCWVNGYIYRHKKLAAMRRCHAYELKTVTQMKRKAA